MYKPANKYLQETNHEKRLDHRSYKITFDITVIIYPHH